MKLNGQNYKSFLIYLLIAFSPLFVFFYYFFRDLAKFKLLLFVLPSSLVSVLIILLVVLIHKKRVKEKTRIKNVSISCFLLFFVFLACYVSIDTLSDLKFARHGSSLDIVIFAFLPVYSFAVGVIGYLIGWIIEILIRKHNKISLQEDKLNKQKVFMHISKNRLVYIMAFVGLICYLSIILWAKYAPSYGLMPLFNIHYATEVGSIRGVERFIKKGVNINSLDEDDYAPLHIAALHCENKMLEYLITKGADIDVPSRIRQTPLHTAARNGCLDAVIILIANGADVNFQDKNGDSPLKEAARKGHDDIVKYLIKNKANVNLKNYNNQTPIFQAVWYGHEDITEILLQNGAEVNIKDSMGRTPISMAKEKKYKAIEKMLVEYSNVLEKY